MPDNPFVSGDTLDAIKEFTRSTVTMAGLLVALDQQLVKETASAMAFQFRLLGTDDLDGQFAGFHELARLLVHGGLTTDLPEVNCSGDACRHRHVLEQAWIEAVAREDFTAAQNVLTATVKYARQAQEEPLGAVCDLFAGCVVMGVVAIGNLHNPR